MLHVYIVYMYCHSDTACYMCTLYTCGDIQYTVIVIQDVTCVHCIHVVTYSTLS